MQQVQPTIELLTHLDTWHPDILQARGIQPRDYHRSLVFRSAVESIRGSFIASSTAGREQLVAATLQALQERHAIADYRQSSRTGRYDFTVALERNPDYFAALEVKGGEGNSINISDRPLWAREFGLWCHLDGAIVNQPASGARAIVNRVTNELVRRQKLVDVVFFKDPLCGTPTRPCPKYPGQEISIATHAAPDIFLFPQRVPTLSDRQPPTHTLDTLRLPRALLQLFGSNEREQQQNHIWSVQVTLIALDDGRLRRKVQVMQRGEIVLTITPPAWRP